MTDFTDPAGAGIRLSDSEREEAVRQLEAARRHGRLTDEELADRSAKARAGVTRGDLAPLFSDLPRDAAVGVGGSTASGRGFDWLYVLRYASPLVALVLFVITGLLWGWAFSWLWFIIVPVVWAIVGAAGGTPGRRPGDESWSSRPRD